MTEFFLYENLTYPEVAALPRHTPLVIPLGEGYAMERMADALGNPDKVGLLPAIPFGWRGSGLVVPEARLGKMVCNLVDSLREDGFTRIHALVPQNTDLKLGSARISLHAIPRRPALLPDIERSKVVLIPVGHTEQHALHLPMSTDTLIIEAISRGTAQRASDQAYTLPVMPYGVSMHRSAFAGTLNAGGRAFEDFWVAVIDTLVERGFDRMYFLSGHGGNMSFLVNVVKFAGDRHPHIFCATASLYLSGEKGVAALARHRQSKIGGMGHACELETSLILFIKPELVHMERVVDEINFISTPSYYMDWIEGGALVANPPWEDDTATGAYGAGSLGTAKKGKLWLEAAIEEKADHVAEIIEQQERRSEKRCSQGLGSSKD
jgi:creatinine amidohydrolase